MSLFDYWGLLRRSWLLIVATTVGGAFLGLIYAILQPSVYSATTQLFVNVQSQGNLGTQLSGGLFVQQRIKSYIDVVDTPGVLEPVIEELGLDTTPQSLASRVTAMNPPNTVLLNVSVADTDPKQATAIANAVAVSFASQIQQLESGDATASPTPSPTPTSPATPQVPMSTIQATVIKPAVGAGKLSPKPGTNFVIGGLLGLIIGVGVAVLRHSLDTTVKTHEELEELSGAATLGSIHYDPQASGSPLVTLRETPRAEAFRTIRTNLQYVDVDHPPRVVVITSSLPDEGKSTTACNIAIALSQAGARVVLIEGDLRKPKVGEYLQVSSSRGLTDVLVGRLPLSQAIVRWGRGILDFIPAGTIPPNPSELLGSKHMALLIQELRSRYDVVILDTPPLLPVTDAAVMSTIADGAILVARYGQTRRDQVQDAADALEQVNARLLGTILNFVPVRNKGYGDKYGYGYGYGYTQESRQTAQPAQPSVAPAPQAVGRLTAATRAPGPNTSPAPQLPGR